MPTDRHIVLLGLMGAGKSSVGRRVAKRLGRDLVDGDVVLDERTGGMTAAEVADSEGIDALHDMEAQIALDALASTTPAVIGPAASTIEVDAVRQALAHPLVAWPKPPASSLAERSLSKAPPPLLDAGAPPQPSP